MTVTTILLIRHAQTDWNKAGRWQGHTDIPLNDAGRSQAEALARRLSSWPIRAVYSSDLQRAAATADALAAALGLTTLYDPNWRERTVGVLEGLTIEVIEACYPGQWSQLRRGLVGLPGCESQPMLCERVAAAFAQLVQRHEGEMAAVVSHGGALHALVAHLLGLPIQQESRFSIRGNTSLSIVEVNAHGPRLVLLNDTSHLKE